MLRTLIVASFAATALFGSLDPAAAQIKIGLISSSTGQISVVGIPQKNTATLLPKEVGGVKIDYLVFDDGSDPTQTVQQVQRLISENVDAIIGPSGSPNAASVIGFIAEAKTPLLAPVGSAAVVLPMDEKKKWVFKTTQNDDLIAAALIEHMTKTGIKTVGLIAVNDPYGENWVKTFGALAQKAGINVVATEKYQRADTSVTAQSLKILAANPDAVLVAAAGASTILPQITLVDQGYKGKIYQTHGAAAPDFLKLGGKKVEGTILAASLMLVLDEIPDANPSKKIATDYIAAYKAAYGVAPATFGANVYDAGLLLSAAVPEALKQAKPGTPEFRTALRDALEKTKELVATQGVYNMTPADHSGFDQRGRVMIVVKDGGWHLLQ
ncbi:MAG: ABC transporter substrate-binding protein [Rhodopseudomonas sp.]|uniref:ABC transporter substrate-binding protein n=1 Tax=Rhodopseudomonas sp. TaxID=1078 RepID=UPI00178DD8E8|nr:ABC transporter substrate-binding protein [Rhodopseudomonas sp.]NVN85507.1 ABC transporter substrate-binding protein [Rhodopseudomonas sp.]